MARKAMISKQDIQKAAFSLASDEGIGQVTARKLAARAGCSTQPIFRVYRNMDELQEDVFRLAVGDFHAFYRLSEKKYDIPFVNLGIAYIKYAQERGNLFRMLFLSENRFGRSFYEILNGEDGAVLSEIQQAEKEGCKEPQQLFMRMWIFINGAACMSLTRDYDLSEEETIKLLEENYHAWL